MTQLLRPWDGWRESSSAQTNPTSAGRCWTPQTQAQLGESDGGVEGDGSRRGELEPVGACQSILASRYAPHQTFLRVINELVPAWAWRTLSPCRRWWRPMRYLLVFRWPMARYLTSPWLVSACWRPHGKVLTFPNCAGNQAITRWGYVFYPQTGHNPCLWLARKWPSWIIEPGSIPNN